MSGRRAPLGRLGWSIISLVMLSLACAVAAPVLGEWLRYHSPAAPLPDTGQVVRTVITPRTGRPSAPFYISAWKWWGWELLSVVVWLPLLACCGAIVWMYALAGPRRRTQQD